MTGNSFDAVDRIILPSYEKALAEGPGNHFFDFMNFDGNEKAVRDYLQSLIQTMKKGMTMTTTPKPKPSILSDDSEETIAIRRVLKEKVANGERLYVLHLTGQTQDKNRAILLRAMHKKAKEAASRGKSPWDVLRLTIEPEPENKADTKAVAVYCWWKINDEWKRVKVGYLKANDNGNFVGQNQTILSFLESQKVKRVRYKMFPEAKQAQDFMTCYKVYTLRVYAPPDTQTPALTLGIVTDHDAIDLPQGCSAVTSYYRHPESGKVFAGTAGMPGVKPVEVVAPKTPVEKIRMSVDNPPPQAVAVRDWPTVDQLKELMELLSEHEQFFFHEEIVDGRRGVLLPVAIHEWRGALKTLKNADDIEAAIREKRLGDFYGDFVHAADLAQMEKDHGPIMAERYYHLTGGFAGPFDTLHIQSMIVTMRSIVKALKAFKGQTNG